MKKPILSSLDDEKGIIAVLSKGERIKTEFGGIFTIPISLSFPSLKTWFRTKFRTVSVDGSYPTSMVDVKVKTLLMLCKFNTIQNRNIVCNSVGKKEVLIAPKDVEKIFKGIEEKVDSFVDKMVKEANFNGLESKHASELAWFMNASSLDSLKYYMTNTAQLARPMSDISMDQNPSLMTSDLDVGAENFSFRKKQVKHNLNQLVENALKIAKHWNQKVASSFYAKSFNSIQRSIHKTNHLLDEDSTRKRIFQITQNFPVNAYKHTNGEIRAKRLDYQDIGFDFHFFMDRAFRLGINKGIIPLKMTNTTLPYSKIDQLSRLRSRMRERGIWKVGPDGRLSMKDEELNNISKNDPDRFHQIDENGDPWSFFNRELEVVKYTAKNRKP